jgi:hypothetical protein
MQVTINGEPQEATLTIKRADGQLDNENLYVNDLQVARVTHSRVDDTPVVLVVDEDTVIEVDPQPFYSIQGMHHDWQPGFQEGSLGVA